MIDYTSKIWKEITNNITKITGLAINEEEEEELVIRDVHGFLYISFDVGIDKKFEWKK